MDSYDYIIAGGGCAGLSLVMHLIQTGAATSGNILLIDKAPKTVNDRTWCFWEKGEGLFEPVVSHRWERLWFYGTGYADCKQILPYRYKMIRSLDFYNYCHAHIRAQDHITVLYGEIEHINSEPLQDASVVVNGQTYQGRYIFSSILPENPVLGKKDFYLLQHFKGWIIETPGSVFSPGEATLMDFRVGQQRGTSFVYVMPFSPVRALVEYTLFTESLLEQQDYEQGLKNYISDILHISDYQVHEEEFGIIPMTNFHFRSRENQVYYIGTAGGQTKASSGYTFQFIQKQSRQIAASLLETGVPPAAGSGSKYQFYDSVLLNVLATGKLPGDRVFTDMFRRNPMDRIFRFLDNESSLLEDLQVISTLPTMPFLKAGWQQL